MVVNKTSRIITSIITIFVAVLIGIIIFFVKQNDNSCVFESRVVNSLFK